jgi:heavy metal translocating P-type ATPase
MTAADAPRCAHCGTPLRRGWRDRPAGAAAEAVAGAAAGAAAPEAPQWFCCFGCALARRIAGDGDGGPASILARLGLALFFAMNVMMLSMVLYAGDPAASPGGSDPFSLGMASLFRWVLLLFATPVMLVLGPPILGAALPGRGRPGSAVDALIALGAFAAFALSAWATIAGRGEVYYETACMTLVLLTAGRWLEAGARGRAAASLRPLLPDTEPVTVLRGGAPVAVPSSELRSGDLVRVFPGGTVPVDGRVIRGEGAVDESSLTGAALPARRGPGDAVLAGTVSLDGAFDVRAGAVGGDRMQARVAAALEAARAARAPIERLADRAAALFTPVAVLAALATAVWWTHHAGIGTGLNNGLAVLLIACPCALGLATPLAIQAGLARAAGHGVIVKSGEALERLASVRTVFFDKTGTLGDGPPRLVAIEPEPGLGAADLLRAAATVESVSEHPLGRAIVETARARGLEPGTPGACRVHPGVGVEGEVLLPGGAPVRIAVGGAEMLRRAGIGPGARPEDRADGAAGPTVFVAADRRILGRFRFAERLRPGAAGAVRALAGAGLGVEILTGDTTGAAAPMAAALGVPVRAGLSPVAKAEAIAAREAAGGPVLMVGDGINDAPALARAGLSIAVGSARDLSREASDIVLLRGDLEEIPALLRIARRTVRTIRLNLLWAFGYNAALVPLAMSGRLRPVLAAAAMVASGLLVAATSLRAGRERARAPRRRERSPAAPRRLAAETR